MAVLLSDPPEALAREGLPHKLWTRDEVAILESTGLFDGSHFELIDGELIDKMGKKLRHVLATRQCARVLEFVFGFEFVLQEAPIDVRAEDHPRNEPEPDVVVLKHPVHAIAPRNPAPAEVALVVEVADTTLRYDMTAKARLYARAGISEYWILDLNGRRLLVFRDPAGDSYHTRLAFGENDSVSPLEKPAAVIAVKDLLA